MQVSKWGNSLAVRLPAKLVAEMGLKEGDEVDIRRAADGALEITRADQIDQAFATVRALRGSLPAGYRFKREDAYPSNRGGTDSDD